MAVLTKEQFLETLKSRIGGSVEESDLKFLEDFTDTYNDLETKAAANGADEIAEWKQKYEENDSAWRQRYRDRFFGKSDDSDPSQQQQQQQGLGLSQDPAPEDVSLDSCFITDAATVTDGAVTAGLNI